ncbi:hypothetical protein Spith_0650 [Spirochaeta thermophila DSM 6578]|uniref:UTP--glucose-1-phosphate uridylyltransferase n=1 Tax=Winmispira thermophila (strain ATCC 700085 / DSM 6578 / Z-1203) TaxID=869211 RepID=G0GA94_WINT7|nr:UTP--glucose-1-phosphate uridylyltransferase [Spirochaeta thermophila]AEJ60930.1 hypothetical protein Spith_0650 [Spirochaeta thermophila DSM 6578]
MQDDALIQKMRTAGIDPDLTYAILERVNAAGPEAAPAFELPSAGDPRIVDATQSLSLTLPRAAFLSRAEELSIPSSLIDRYGREAPVVLDDAALFLLGVALYPRTAYGVLNGGAATSYADLTRNRAFEPDLFEVYRTPFEAVAPRVKGSAKGACPAFYQEDTSGGPSFLALTLRNLLFCVALYRRMAEQWHTPLRGTVLPFFQMTSPATHEQVMAHLEELRGHPLLEELFAHTGYRVDPTLSAQQPLVAALTHREEGLPRRIFTRAYGKDGEVLPLPGGHGQNFMVLEGIYRRLHEEGFRFVYLTNVDNLGAFVEPRTLAYTAFSRAQASFEFSYKTPVDVKGGILVRAGEVLSCRDIGPAIPKEAVAAFEKEGRPVLFNCAIGLFDLTHLTAHLEHIIRTLPLRVSEQEKDAGRYAQAEQITWEVMDLIERPLVFGVDKFRRFLAAKLLLETFLTGGLHFGRSELEAFFASRPELARTARALSAGFRRVMEEAYGYVRTEGMWRPLRMDEALARMQAQGGIA